VNPAPIAASCRLVTSAGSLAERVDEVDLAAESARDHRQCGAVLVSAAPRSARRRRGGGRRQPLHPLAVQSTSQLSVVPFWSRLAPCIERSHDAANLVAALGSYGGAFAIGALASLLPLLRIDVFLVALRVATAELPIYAASRGIQRRVLDLCRSR